MKSMISLNWGTLENRNTKHFYAMMYMYKVLHDLAPEYLKEKCCL